MDLLDLWRPDRRLTWRKMGVLVRQLPPESATATAMRVKAGPDATADAADAGDPAEGRWSHEEMLLASAVDAVRRVEWAIIAVNSERGKAPKQPEPMPRPGVGVKRRKHMTAAQYRLLTGEAPPLELLQGGA